MPETAVDAAAEAELAVTAAAAAVGAALPEPVGGHTGTAGGVAAAAAASSTAAGQGLGAEEGIDVGVVDDGNVADVAVGDGDGDDGDISPAEARLDLLLYNRVPKSGSSTVQDYIDKLSQRLGYKAVHYVRPPQAKFIYINHTRLVDHNVTTDHITRLARHLARMPKRHGRSVCVDYHFPFLNFTALGMRQPLYVNTLRDPIERSISQYYYARYGPRPATDRRAWLRNFGNLSVDKCADVYRECNCTGDCFSGMTCTRNRCADLFAQYNAQMMFFCTWGSDDCKARDGAALAHAKRVLSDAYAVFGILERHDETLELLEARLPRFFRGISRAARRGGNTVSRRNDDKEDVSPATKAFLRQVNALDMEFYAYATRLFDERYQQLVAARQAKKGKKAAKAW